MENLINATNIRTVDFIKGRQITGVRFISKSRAGFMTISEGRDFDLPRYNSNPEGLISGYKKGALQTVEVQLDGSDYYFTVFARQGSKIHLVDEVILADLTVGTINGMFYNTQLYDHRQYQAVGATSWASKAYVKNEPVAQ